VPSQFKQKIKIDHKVEKFVDGTWERLWIEDKGWCGLSLLIEGFGRVSYAVLNGGGKGLLAVPTENFNVIMEQIETFKQMAFDGMGILDAEKQEVYWFK